MEEILKAHTHQLWISLKIHTFKDTNKHVNKWRAITFWSGSNRQLTVPKKLAPNFLASHLLNTHKTSSTWGRVSTLETCTVHYDNITHKTRMLVPLRSSKPLQNDNAWEATTVMQELLGQEAKRGALAWMAEPRHRAHNYSLSSGSTHSCLLSVQEKYPKVSATGWLVQCLLAWDSVKQRAGLP